MVANQNGKFNISSLHVMKTLLTLMEEACTMQTLVEKLNAKEKESIFNNSVVSKYINTCRYCDVEIPKIQNKYFVAKIPFGLNISTSDIELLKKMQNLCQDCFSKTINKGFNAFLDKINRFSNKTLLRIEKETFNLTFEAFEKAIKEERKIRLILKTQAEIDCIPLSITTHQKRTYFRIKHENKEKSIALDRIIGIEILNEVFKTADFEKNITVFEVRGNLAHRYNLRENETMIKQENSVITIENRGEDINLLLSRLLRYDSLCEVKSPALYRSEMRKIINETLANYGE